MEAGRDFQNYFGFPITPFYDGFTTMLFKKIKINSFRFDDYLHQLHGEYEQGNKMLSDIILEKYGEEALHLIEELS
ncbi:hypothetical protein EZS27_005346 [termite gut metagenome]|uniref:Uncharacterized protein n=1 Tax=termite gut metagenome TaxID=433724 RepID=A0A5J4SMH6_9ZZZZ